MGVVVVRWPEPASLRLFRRLAAAQLAVATVVVILLTAAGAAQSRHSAQLLGMVVLSSAALYCWIGTPALARRSGTLYLVVAIALSALPVLAGEWLLARERRPFVDYLGATAELELLLLFPLLGAAWRLGAAAVTAVAVLVAVVDVAVTQAGYPREAAALGYDRIALVRLGCHLAVGLLVVALLRDQRGVRRSLESANRRLAGHTAVLEELAAARERNRLARELHDTLAHTLSGLAVQLEAVRAVRDDDPERADALTDAALHSVRHGLVETRRALADLRAGPLSASGLEEALRRSADDAAARCGAVADVELRPGRPPLPDEVEQAVYRVAEEALENVVRHARAGRFTVTLRHVAELVELTVQDDGLGFDPDGPAAACRVPSPTASAPPPLGLLGMRERAALCGGELRVTTRPGDGTTVTLRIPAPPHTRPTSANGVAR